MDTTDHVIFHREPNIIKEILRVLVIRIDNIHLFFIFEVYVFTGYAISNYKGAIEVRKISV